MLVSWGPKISLSTRMAEDKAAETSLSHKEALEITKDALCLLLRDPLLKDVTQDLSSKEIKAKIDLEKGRAFVVNLKRVSEEDDFEYFRKNFMIF